MGKKKHNVVSLVITGLWHIDIMMNPKTKSMKKTYIMLYFWGLLKDDLYLCGTFTPSNCKENSKKCKENNLKRLSRRLILFSCLALLNSLGNYEIVVNVTFHIFTDTQFYL